MPAIQVSATAQISSPTAPVSVPGLSATSVPAALAEINAKVDAQEPRIASSETEINGVNTTDLVLWFENRLA